MNKVMGCIAAALTLAALSGCTTYDRAESYVTKPVVKDVKKGITRYLSDLCSWRARRQTTDLFRKLQRYRSCNELRFPELCGL
jgi:hypothetical protein